MNLDSPERLKSLILKSAEFAGAKDFDILMDSILHSARTFVNCDAGSIYIRRNGFLEFSYTQNETLAQADRGISGQLEKYTLPVDAYSIAGYAALKGVTVNVPDVYRLPADVPYRFNPMYDRMTCYQTSSLIAIPLRTNTGAIIGVLQLINARDGQDRTVPFDPGIEPYLTYFALHAANAIERAILTRAILMRMISMTEYRDPNETGDHVRRVAGYAVEIYDRWAKKQGLPPQEIMRNRDILYMAAMLHDVGKAAISDTILKKPGKLTLDEFEIIKQHTIMGARLLNEPTSEYEQAAMIVALNHHERFDGKGYPGHIEPYTGEPVEGHTDRKGNPRPKKGDEIPLMGRIVAIADVFDALSFPRVYKNAWAQEDVLSLLWEESGKQFDPELIEVFFDSLIRIESIKERFS